MPSPPKPTVVVVRNDGHTRAIVFVHGLNGDPIQSWGDFPKAIAAEKSLDGWDIFSVRAFPKGWRSLTLPYRTFTERFYSQLLLPDLVAHQELAFITHGEGGLVAQLAVLDHPDLAERVTHAFFFASPNGGIRLPYQNVFEVFGRLQSTLGLGAFDSIYRHLFPAIIQILPGSEFLNSLNQRWRERDGKIKVWSIGASNDQIVSYESLTAFPADARLVIEADHFSINKPTSPDDASVRIVIDGLNEQPMPKALREPAAPAIELESKARAGHFDVFVYYDPADSTAARQLSEELKRRGCRPWLDVEQVHVGQSWEEKLLDAIGDVDSAAVLIGKAGIAKWEKEEPASLIREFDKRAKAVIPVFLPQAPREELRGPLQTRLAVDLRQGSSDSLDDLVSGIRGNMRARAGPEPSIPPPAFSSVAPAPLAQIASRRRMRARTVLALILLFVPSVAYGGWRAYKFYLDCGPLREEAVVLRPERMKSRYVRRGDSTRVLVFVHGIFGDAGNTWTAPPDTYWPDLVAHDTAFGNADIYVAAYDTGLTNKMRIDQVVTTLEERFADAGVFARHQQVILVCHSLGGLIMQEYLLTNRDDAKKVPFIYFYSTPQTGAQIAKLGSMFSDDPLLREMAPDNSNDYLRRQENEWQRAKFRIHRYCAYETQKFKCALIVEEMSGTRLCEQSVALNKNHANIVKPTSTDDMPYVLLRNAWRGLGSERPGHAVAFPAH